MIGLITPSRTAVTISWKARAITRPTAMVTTLPLLMNVLNSSSMPRVPRRNRCSGTVHTSDAGSVKHALHRRGRDRVGGDVLRGLDVGEAVDVAEVGEGDAPDADHTER